MPNIIETTGVTESAFQYLKVYIISGHLAPGSKLNETALASQLEISRPPLREAFRRLENERLVVSVPRRGCYVAEISSEDCLEICQAWEMIELFAVDLLRSMTHIDLTELEAVLSKASDLSTPADTDPVKRYEYLLMISDFHVKLVEATKHETMIQLYKSILPSLARYQNMFISEHTPEAHQAIMRSIQDKKYTEAKRLLRDHIRQVRDRLGAKFINRGTV